MENISVFLKTKKDKAYFLSQLELAGGQLFSVGSSIENTLHKNFSFGVAESLLLDMKDQGINYSDQAAVQSYLQALKDHVERIPFVTLRVSFEPSFDILSNLSVWFDAVSGRHLIIDYTVDTGLIGGVIMEINGQYYDYSVKHRLDEILAQDQLSVT